VEPLPNPYITSNPGLTQGVACVEWNTSTIVNNLKLDSNVTNAGYQFEWFADGQLIPFVNTSTHTPLSMTKDQVVYTVRATSPNGCISPLSPAFVVIRSGSAAQIAYTLTDGFADNQTLTVTNTGYGQYQYSLDNGPILDNAGVFTNVSIGAHTVTIYDVKGGAFSCQERIIAQVETVDYPHFFTPNGDGVNDQWNINGLSGKPGIKIYIFDRHGKLLKELIPSSPGWDGTYNGNALPASDYWFTVEYPDDYGNTRTYRGHFALKR
jgi:hypothetical protein